MKKETKVKKPKRVIYLLSFCLFLLLVFIIFSLDNYLFTIQRTERLSKLENYDNFTMTAHFENRCQNHEIMTIDEKTLYYECIDQIYIHYGSMSVFLKEALEKEYVTIESILSHTIKISSQEEGSSTVYLYQNTRKGINFEIYITDTSITFKPVQSS